MQQQVFQERIPGVCAQAAVTVERVANKLAGAPPNILVRAYGGFSPLEEGALRMAGHLATMVEAGQLIYPYLNDDADREQYERQLRCIARAAVDLTATVLDECTARERARQEEHARKEREAAILAPQNGHAP